MNCLILLLVSSATYFLKISACLSLRVVTNGLFTDKKSSKISIFHAIIVKQKRRSATKAIYVFQTCSATYFLEVGVCLSLKLATKASFGGKKLWKFRFSGCFSKAKTGEWDQKNWSFSYKFGMLMPVSETYFLEVSPHVSLEVATKGFFRGKRIWKVSIFKAFLLKQIRRSAAEKIGLSLINLVWIYLVQVHTFWK